MDSPASFEYLYMQPRSFSKARAEAVPCRRAVLLAGGQGLRVWNPGLRESKLSLPLLGETVLEHQCRWLARQGIRRLAVALCDDAGEPLRHPQEPTRVDGVDLVWCHERLRQGTAGCLRSLRSFLGEEPFLILHQSVVPGELDLAPLLVDGFGDGEILRVLVEEGPRDHFHGVILEEGGAVRSFYRDHPSDAQQWARCLEIYYAHPKLLDELPEDGYWDLKEQLIPGLREKGFGVRCVRAPSGLPLLDGPEDHLSALRWLLYSLPSGRGERKVLPGVWARGEVEIAPSAHVAGPVLLEDGVVIQEQAHIIGPAYLAAGVTVGKSAIVRESALWEGSAVGEQASVYYSILAEGQRAMAGEEILATVRCDQDHRFGEGLALAGAPVSAGVPGANGRRGLVHRAAKRLLDIVGSILKDLWIILETLWKLATGQINGS
jgi:NDP-sugar pyrophosphorylase family protein